MQNENDPITWKKKMSSKFMENKHIRHWRHFFPFFAFCWRDFSLKDLKGEGTDVYLMLVRERLKAKRDQEQKANS